MRLLALILTTGLLIGCSGSPQPPQSSQPAVPEWVLNEPRSDRYAYGIGSATLRGGDQATARRVATERARNQLISGLRVTISGQTETWIDRVRDDQSDSVTRGFAERVTASVPETTLDELEVVEAEPDSTGETLYVLVRLDRPMAANRISADLNRVRRQVEEFRTLETPAGDRIQAVRMLKPAAALVAQAGQLESQLQLVSTSALPRDPVAVEYADVLDRLSDALDNLRLSIDDNGLEPRLVAGLQESLTRQGLRVGTQEQPDLILGGQMDLRVVERAPDYFAVAEGQLSLQDHSGRVLSQFNHRVREASTDPDTARDRVIRSLANGLGRTIGEELFQAL